MDGERIQVDLKAYETQPPHDLGAERAALGALMIGDAAVKAQVRSTVNRDDFYLADHQIIFETACEVLDRGVKLDAIQLRAALKSRQLLREVGGIAMIADILDSLIAPEYGVYYAEIVRDRSLRRRLISFGADCQRQGYAPSRMNDADEVVGNAVNALSKLVISGRSANFIRIADLLDSVTDQLEQGGAQLIPSGVEAIDIATGGIGVGEMCIVAARPSMGKSTFLRQVVVAASRKGNPIGFISLEEGGLKIGRNLLSASCGIENQKLRKGQVDQDNWNEITASVADIGGLPIFISESARRVRDIRALTTLWSARYGVKMIVLDYLQRVRGGSGDSEYEKISSVSGDLSDLWKETGVAAIVAAQLNRAVENRSEKRPIMADLRSSGQIEQDADSIIFLHREDYYHLDDGNYTPTGVAEFIIAKWRDGARGGVVKMQSDLRHQRFLDIPEPEFQDPFA